ncbi:Alpha-ribazole-5'-phosphate phosphatase [hydrothermal vent metagenome]|uniref:Alpha-ribazole-5'-phosphate phosphatase n=1 Tax=hydrothermal vent metagenome TaxID=652676 RepID=A0A3B0ZP41_9ZZZZ
MSDTLIDLLRHGIPEGGRAYRGHNIDDPLSEKGWAQMWAAVGGEAAESVPWTHIVSSPLIRCRDFAEALGTRHGLPVTVDARFREVGFGCWEGRTPEQIQHDNPDEYAAFFHDPVHSRPPGAEPLTDFVARVASAFDDCLQAYAGKQVLVVAHAGVVRALMAHVLQADLACAYRVVVNNACFTRCRLGERGLLLEFHNCPVLSGGLRLP